MKRASGWVATLALLAQAGAGAAIAQEAEIDRNMLNGNWELVLDTDDGARRAFVFSLGGVEMAFQDSIGIAYGRGSVTLTRAGERVQGSVTGISTMIVGGPKLEAEEAMNFQVVPVGDGFDLWTPGHPERYGRMHRTNCGLEMVFRERSDTPPEGCVFLEIVGVGFDMLTGECEYHEEWAENWDAIRLTPEGEPTPVACLVTVPASFGGAN